jgi:hypothetical protein
MDGYKLERYQNLFYYEIVVVVKCWMYFTVKIVPVVVTIITAFVFSVFIVTQLEQTVLRCITLNKRVLRNRRWAFIVSVKDINNKFWFRYITC